MLVEVVALYRHHAEHEPGWVTQMDATIMATDSNGAELLETTNLGPGVVGFEVEVNARGALLEPLVGQHLAGPERREHGEGRAILGSRLASQGS